MVRKRQVEGVEKAYSSTGRIRALNFLEWLDKRRGLQRFVYPQIVFATQPFNSMFRQRGLGQQRPRQLN